jgi:DNA-binding FrmR family transcriptional regulator
MPDGNQLGGPPSKPDPTARERRSLVGRLAIRGGFKHDRDGLLTAGVRLNPGFSVSRNPLTVELVSLHLATHVVTAARAKTILYPPRLSEKQHVAYDAREVEALEPVRRIRGHIEAIERALEQEIGCADVMQLIAAARGAIGALMAEVMEDHVRMHVMEPEPAHGRGEAAEELIDVVRSYLK